MLFLDLLKYLETKNEIIVRDYNNIKSIKHEQETVTYNANVPVNVKINNNMIHKDIVKICILLVNDLYYVYLQDKYTYYKYNITDINEITISSLD